MINGAVYRGSSGAGSTSRGPGVKVAQEGADRQPRRPQCGHAANARSKNRNTAIHPGYGMNKINASQAMVNSDKSAADAAVGFQAPATPTESTPQHRGTAQ